MINTSNKTYLREVSGDKLPVGEIEQSCGLCGKTIDKGEEYMILASLKFRVVTEEYKANWKISCMDCRAKIRDFFETLQNKEATDEKEAG